MCSTGEKNQKIKCFSIDSPGSVLFNKATMEVMYTREETQGQRLENPFDTIIEGIGIKRLTQNFMVGWNQQVTMLNICLNLD